MITLEEMDVQGMQMVGSEPQPEFIVNSKAYKAKNASFSLIFQDLFNSELNINDYSSFKIKYVSFIYLIFPKNWNGVQRPERKYYKRNENKFFIDIRFPDYNKFITATKQEALEIMALETLRGAKKFLSDVNDFNFELFYYDLESLFKEHKLIS